MQLLVVRDCNRLRVFENMVHRKTFGPKSEQVIGDLRNYITGGFMICVSDQMF